MNNRLWNCENPHQGNSKKVLCVCSAGLLRSPTAAVVLSGGDFNYNTRAVGTDTSHALVPLDKVLFTWADEIVCMDLVQLQVLLDIREDLGVHKDLICLDIPDIYGYRDPELMELIKNRYQEEIL